MKKLYLIIVVLLFAGGCAPKLITEKNINNFDFIVAQADNDYTLKMSELYNSLYNSTILQNGGVLDTLFLKHIVDSILCDTLTGFVADDVNLPEHYEYYRVYKLLYNEFLIRSYFDEKVFKTIELDSLKIVDFYNSRPDLFSLDEMVKIYQILISEKGLKYGPDSINYNHLNEEELTKATEDHVFKIREMLTDSLTFYDSAKKYSHDTISGKNGGFVGWVKRGYYVDPFDSVAFSLRDNEISMPYKDKGGWHILYCAEYIPEGMHELNEPLYKSAKETYINVNANEIGGKLVDSLFKHIEVTYNDPIMDSNLYLVDKQEWLAIVNGTDTIDCNESRAAELAARKEYKVENTNAEMKKRMIKQLVERYKIVQAAREEGIEKLDYVTEKQKELYHKYQRSVIEKDRYDPSWSPDDSLIEKYYNDHQQDFLIEKPLNVQHIIVQDSLFGEFLRDQAMSGIDFLDLAKENYPGDENIRLELANLGQIGPGDVPDEFYQMALTVPLGEISHPVKTKYGYHIIKVVERQDNQTVDQARSKIINVLVKQHRQDVFMAYRDSVYQRYHVEFPNKLYPVHLKPTSFRDFEK